MIGGVTASVLGVPVAALWGHLWPVLVVMLAIGLVVAMAAVWLLVDLLDRRDVARYTEHTTTRPGGGRRG